jgi:hypothetical protein
MQKPGKDKPACVKPASLDSLTPGPEAAATEWVGSARY